jgi:hypothetical protein
MQYSCFIYNYFLKCNIFFVFLYFFFICCGKSRFRYGITLLSACIKFQKKYDTAELLMNWIRVCLLLTV